LHLQVARNIRNQIEAGVLRNGDMLPSTRELAQQWDVSVFTINEAMKVLIDEGLVASKSRSKRVVIAPSRPQAHEVRTTQPQLLLIGGYAGSGKTELGRILARQTGWPILDKDTLTRPILEGALEILGLSPNDRESDRYHSLLRPLEYRFLMAAVRENIDCGTASSRRHRSSASSATPAGLTARSQPSPRPGRRSRSCGCTATWRPCTPTCGTEGPPGIRRSSPTGRRI
jgi:hypothetical protein